MTKGDMPQRSQAHRYWLVKSEPSVFSIDDLASSPKRTTCWDGVRNYQARNFMREMSVEYLDASRIEDLIALARMER